MSAREKTASGPSGLAADPEFFGQLVEDLRFVLNEAAARELVPAYTGERSPIEIDFLYRPPADRSQGEQRPGVKTASGTAQAPERAAARGPARELPVNARCTLCSDRLYPVRRYRRTGRKPILLLYYNGAFGGGKQKPDRSDKQIFATAAEDDLFARMLSAAGLAVDDLYYQEYTACHFNDSRSLPEEWNERAGHCLGHVADTIKEFDIRILLLTGPAAIFLLSEEKARQHAQSGEALRLPLADREIPALVLRSPAALLALEQRREKLKAAGPEKEAEFQKTLGEEKQIKTAVLNSLKRTLNV